MKVLAIDAGNTRLKWGVNESGVWIARGVAATADADAVTEALSGNASVDYAVIANVAGDQVAGVIRAALPEIGAVEWVAGQPAQCGVRNGYADPAQLGADRWAALIGARHLRDGPCVVVNAGTAMTADALAADGMFLGGIIVAGYDLMRGALERNTARLTSSEGAFAFFPDNTNDAIASGALNALAGAVEHIVTYMEDTGENEPAIILSGGNAALIEPRLIGRVVQVENLVLEGLVVIGNARG